MADLASRMRASAADQRGRGRMPPIFYAANRLVNPTTASGPAGSRVRCALFNTGQTTCRPVRYCAG